MSPYTSCRFEHWSLNKHYMRKNSMIPNHHIRQQRKSQLPEQSNLMPSKMAKDAGNYSIVSQALDFSCVQTNISPFTLNVPDEGSFLEPNQASVKEIFYFSESLIISEFNGKGQDSLKKTKIKAKEVIIFLCNFLELLIHQLNSPLMSLCFKVNIL